ncbi:MAG: radical SAM protein [Deltaproteobacteria bacterium]|nr:radical SAM protein [Deltaproteobacteria bacterium]
MREIIDQVARVPRTCTWELTLRCNLRCGHCGSRAGIARPGEMPRDAMLRGVRELAALGCERITLSGGEPTLSPHWQAIAAEGARLGVRMNMITNSVGASKELVRQACDVGLANLGVSVDGLRDEHDRVRGLPGLFDRVMELIDQCAVDKMPVGAITTITRGNLRELEAIHDQLVGRVFGWQLQIGAAMGSLLDNVSEQIRPEDLLEVIPAIARLIDKKRIDIRVADNVGYYGPFEKTIRHARTSPTRHWIGCYAGCRHIGIESDGGVKGCLSLQASHATEGNLMRESLGDIWRRERAFAYNRAFSLSDLGGFCRTCEYAAVCRGGCLSMRVCEGGRENPFCYHRVATLASQAKGRRKWHYVPMAIAPAAVLASMGLGCDGSQHEAANFYGIACPGPGCYQHKDASMDQDAAEAPPIMDVALYGEFTPQDAYGVPPYDAPPDSPDAAAPDADANDPDVNEEESAVDPDAMPETGSWYGMDAPDES